MDLTHSEFVTAVRANTVTVILSKERALSLIRQMPQEFRAYGFDVQRGCGCLPWVVWLGVLIWADLRWPWLVAGLLVAALVSHSAWNALGQTAVQAVVERCVQDEMLYHELLGEGTLRVVPRG